MRGIGGQSAVALRAVGDAAVARLDDDDDGRACGGWPSSSQGLHPLRMGLRGGRDHGLLVSDRRYRTVTRHVEDDRSPWPQFEEPLGGRFSVLPQSWCKDLVLSAPSPSSGP